MYAIIKHKFKGPYVNCEECPLFSYEYDDRGIKRNLCLYTENTLWWEDDEIKVDEDCPFEELPRKKKIKEINRPEDIADIEMQYDRITNSIFGKINYDVETIFNTGYNACLEKIIGKEGSNGTI